MSKQDNIASMKGNRVNALKNLGIAVPEGIDFVSNNGGKAYLLQPHGDAPKPHRENKKQGAVIDAALRPEGATLYRIQAEASKHGKKYDLSTAKTYLGNTFAAGEKGKGYGVYFRVVRTDDLPAEERKLLTKVQQDNPKNTGVVVMHCFHKNVGRAPKASDFENGSEAARLMGFTATAKKTTRRKTSAKK